MIGKLTGIVDEILIDSIILNVNAVGYEIFMPTRELAILNIDNHLALFIHTHVREDQITLYGFENFADKLWFNQLNKVNGLASKTSMLILGQFNANQIKDAIVIQDKSMFKTISGIGDKVATRIVNELKDKAIDPKLSLLSSKIIQSKDKIIDKNHIANSVSAKHNDQTEIQNEEEIQKKVEKLSDKTNIHNIILDTLSALENLGYNKSQTLPIVQVATKELDSDKLTLENLITESLKRLN